MFPRAVSTSASNHRRFSSDARHQVLVVVPPKTKSIVDWLCNETDAQIILTDATMPFRKLDEVFEQPLSEVVIGDPRRTAETQLVLSDTTSIAPRLAVR